MIYLLPVLLWLLQLLPFRVLAVLGDALGAVLYQLAKSRRRIGDINLQHCFPEWDAARRQQVLRRHFQLLARTLLEYGVLWYSRPQRLQKLCRINGEERLAALAGRPVILLSAHMVGLEFGGVRLSMQQPLIDIFTHQSNRSVDALLQQHRNRFGLGQLVARNDGIRPVLKALKQGYRLYYLPDQDLGERESIFVPFFGISTATISGLSRLAKASGAVVLPMVAERTAEGYVVHLGPAWDDFPSGDVAADTARMNQQIEAWARRWPEQYFWLHKRFKTRPAGESSFY